MKLNRRIGTAPMACALAFAGMIAGGSTHATGLGKERGDQPAKTLYIWAGDQARVGPDFLAVIDFDQESPGYGTVLRTVPIPFPGAAGNEPHHCHLSHDENVLACGGLLSVLIVIVSDALLMEPSLTTSCTMYDPDTSSTRVGVTAVGLIKTAELPVGADTIVHWYVRALPSTSDEAEPSRVIVSPTCPV